MLYGNRIRSHAPLNRTQLGSWAAGFLCRCSSPAMCINTQRCPLTYTQLGKLGSRPPCAGAVQLILILPLTRNRDSNMVTRSFPLIHMQLGKLGSWLPVPLVVVNSVY